MSTFKLKLVSAPTAPVDVIGAQLKKYCRYLLVGRGLKATTIDNYRKLARSFIAATNTAHPSHEQAIDYMAGIYESGYSYHHIINTALGIARSTISEFFLRDGRRQ